MNQEVYTDISIVSAKCLTKYCGVCVPRNGAEELQRKVSIFYMAVALLYGVYVNVVDIYHTWGDLTHCIFLISNTTCICMTIIKLLILNVLRVELADVSLFVERHFWHCNYDPQEQLIYFKCVKYCKWFSIIVYSALPASLSCYIITPIIGNIGRNKSDRVLPFKMWVDWPLTETPYYELMFIFQSICVYLIGLAYASPDLFICLLNVHVMGQFRILQYKMLSFWKSSNEGGDMIKYTERCYSTLKKCIERHQLLIEFCQKLERVYTIPILTHMAVLSALLGFDCYEITVVDTSFSVRLIFIFHMIGSFSHLGIFAYTCQGMIDESMAICTSLYLGSWNILPMNQIGRSLRMDLKMMMTRSLKPCCLTAGGFFPVSLQTFTALLSSTFSYFTLIREAYAKTEND